MTNQPADLCSAISAIMGDVLVRTPLEPDEDFFECGGDSLRAIEVLQRLGTREDLGGQLGSPEMQALLLENIFEDASPAGLASIASAHA